MPVQVGFQEGGGDLADTACSWPQLTPGFSLPSRAKESFPSLSCLLARSHLLGEGPHLCLFPLWRRGEPRNQGILCSPRAVSQPRIPELARKCCFHLPVALDASIPCLASRGLQMCGDFLFPLDLHLYQGATNYCV